MNILKMIMLWWSLRGADAAADAFAGAAARLLRRVRPPPERLRDVILLRDDLEHTLRLHWPGSNVTLFGALMSGLGVEGSDADCFAQLPAAHQRSVEEVRRVLARHAQWAGAVGEPGARMPHVRLQHAPSGLQCDLSFRHRGGVRNTAVLAHLARLDGRARDLATLVKHWATRRRPAGVRRFMSGYALVSLAIFYLQRVGELPPVAALQWRAEEELVEGWNAGFDEAPRRPSSDASLFELVGGFFRYYDEFDFDRFVVSTFAGVPVERAAFGRPGALPAVFSRYKRRSTEAGFVPLNVSTPVCMQEMFLHDVNVASDVLPEVLSKFKSEVKFVVEAFANPNDDLLNVIMNEVSGERPPRIDPRANSSGGTQSCFENYC